MDAAAIDNDWSTQDVLNVMAYAQTLPTGKPAAVSQTAAAPKSLPYDRRTWSAQRRSGQGQPVCLFWLHWRGPISRR